MAAPAIDILSATDRREVPREEVFYRTRAVAYGHSSIAVQIVNISAGGFMARCDHEFSNGETISVRLPVVGAVQAEVRWSLGGRVGCQFTRMIDLAPYLELLGELVRDAR